MDQNKLTINSAVLENFSAMDKNITAIESILQETYKKMLELDESVWKAKEKEKLDQTFMPYLKKFMESYPDYLRLRVQLARDAVNAHHELDEENAMLKDIVG